MGPGAFRHTDFDRVEQKMRTDSGRVLQLLALILRGTEDSDDRWRRECLEA